MMSYQILIIAISVPLCFFKLVGYFEQFPYPKSMHNIELTFVSITRE